MSLTSKLRTAIGVVFILTIACAISVTAQTPAVADTSSTSATANAATTSEPKKPEAAKPSTAATENTAPDKTAEASRKASNASTSESVPADPPLIPTPAPTNDEWHFQFSPYFWMAGLHGTTGIGNRTVQVDESFSDVFHSLKFAFMGFGEAQKGKLVAIADVEYVNVGDDRGTPGPLFSGVNTKIKLFIFAPEVGYRVFDNPDKGAVLDVVGGIRVWHISTDFSFSPGILPGTQIQDSRTWVDAIVGLHGKADISKKVFVFGLADLGGGGSKFTYQLIPGVGYNVSPKIDLKFAYRVLDVNYNKNGFLYDMNQRGPILGLGIKF